MAHWFSTLCQLKSVAARRLPCPVKCCLTCAPGEIREVGCWTLLPPLNIGYSRRFSMCTRCRGILDSAAAFCTQAQRWIGDTPYLFFPRGVVLRRANYSRFERELDCWRNSLRQQCFRLR